MELVKNYAYAPESAHLSFYRDAKAKENGKIHPLEIKLSANPQKRDVKKFDVIEKTYLERGNGGIICIQSSPFPIDSENFLIPCNLI